jgi:asparagine synthase (glutamine-hydrolysing)
MCGIAGCLQLDEQAASAEAVRCMTDAVAHRGPDASGIKMLGRCGLGHRRLAIIDLSEAGIQPMTDKQGDIWITYNGELYNFLEVRHELEAKGYSFRSGTDTEVLVTAYREWGTDCLQKFNGMFAFAMWDVTQQRLWLARDRIGEKPLFYAHTNNALYFGSEIKAILAHPEFADRSIDYEALAYYLASNYVPAPHTLFKGVRQLLPGQHLVIERNGQMRFTNYWDMQFEEAHYRSEQDYIEEFTALIKDSVRIRLMGDVPFGAFLSGGLDSSTTAYWMAQHLDQPVKTFSVGFREDTFSELEYARTVAQHIHANHFERMVDAEDAELIPRLVWHSEEPTADSSGVAVYAVAQLAREHVTMVHSGDGADEIFAGYPTYTAYYIHQLYRWLPGILRRQVLPALIANLPAADTKIGMNEKLRRFAYGGQYDSSEDAHSVWRVIFNKEMRAALLKPIAHLPGVDAEIVELYQQAFARTTARKPQNRLSYVDTRIYLPSDMLVKVDRMTMAHGLEARVPFLDHRIVELAARMPPSLKLKNWRNGKYIVKAAMRDKLPPITTQRKKSGFNVPNARWMKHGLRDFMTDQLSAAQLQRIGWFDTAVVDKLLRDHFENRVDNSYPLWNLLTLSLWHQQFAQQAARVLA